jgi:hypothetical protein
MRAANGAVGAASKMPWVCISTWSGRDEERDFARRIDGCYAQLCSVGVREATFDRGHRTRRGMKKRIKFATSSIIPFFCFFLFFTFIGVFVFLFFFSLCSFFLSFFFLSVCFLGFLCQ